MATIILKMSKQNNKKYYEKYQDDILTSRQSHTIYCI